MTRGLVQKLFNSIADVGRDLLDIGAGKGRDHSINALCRDLVTQRGEASGMALAREIVAVWQGMAAEQHLAFFEFLAGKMSPDEDAITEAIAAWQGDNGNEALQVLAKALEAPRQELMRRINFAPGGTAAIVSMRKSLLNLLPDNPQLRAVDQDMKHLFTSWFNRGFLELARIDWRTPAVVLEKLIEYEAVHEIDGWEDLRRRLDKDRRCFAFFHPALPDEPLIFVEIALVNGLAVAVQPLLDREVAPIEAEDADTAIFYSISNCQDGLKGISFGNFLIKQVVAELSLELPNLKHFATLSPVPGFRRWLKDVSAPVAGMSAEEIEEVRADLGDDGWSSDPEKEQRMKKRLSRLCVHYFLQVKSRGQPLDPVARFHLGNGARLERLNWMGDSSVNGIAQSAGILVNYYYSLKDIEKNHEAYANDKKIVVSAAILNLAKPR